MRLRLFPSFQTLLASVERGREVEISQTRLDKKRLYTLGGFRTEIVHDGVQTSLVTRMPLPSQLIWAAVASLFLIAEVVSDNWKDFGIKLAVAAVLWALLATASFAQHKYFVHKENME
jgi:hypothetical protein